MPRSTAGVYVVPHHRWRLVSRLTGKLFYRARPPAMFRNRRWSREPFLRAACDQMLHELEWDSLDSGRLHQFTSVARTLGGEPVIVGVLDRADALAEAASDADDVRTEEPEWSTAPLWLYAPVGLDLNPVDAVVHRVAIAR